MDGVYANPGRLSRVPGHEQCHQSFQGYGMGSYSFYNQGVPIYSAEAFQAPDTSREFSSTAS